MLANKWLTPTSRDARTRGAVEAQVPQHFLACGDLRLGFADHNSSRALLNGLSG